MQATSPGLETVRLQDTSHGYGWISIALHWLTAAIVLTMWIVGTMSQVASHEDYPALVRLHSTIGVTAYVLLWARIAWRFKIGHPGPRPDSTPFCFPSPRLFISCCWLQSLRC